MRTAAQWHHLSTAIRPRTEPFIDGKPVPAQSGDRRPTIDPATRRVLAEVAECGVADVDAAVAAARHAFTDRRWAGTAPGDRKRVLLRLARLIEEHADELALLDSLDGGKLITDTSQVDVPGSVAILAWYAEAIDKQYGEIAPTPSSSLALVTQEPLGVAAAVVPWNFPLEMAIWKLAPALAAGNSVVLKPAEETPLSALRLAELAVEAGLPDGVLNVVPGDGPVVGRALGEHPDVDVVAFTGSTSVGKLFLEYAGRSNMKQVWLECGGKSANVVFDDVDLDAAARAVCAGIFTMAGQVCSANSRLVAHRAVKDELLQRVSGLAREIRPGDPLDPETRMGPLVGERHAERVLGMLDTARREAELVVGGSRVPDATSDCFVEPTVFDVPSADLEIWREEVFGPVLAVTSFEDEDEAIALANDSRYALAASVWTNGLARAHRVAAQLRAGTVSVNTVDALDVTVPFGGFGQSGFGRDLSLHALDKFTGHKTTWLQLG